MNILVTINSNYINPLKVMLKSLFFNNPGVFFSIYLIHSGITDEETGDLVSFVQKEGHQLIPLRISTEQFRDAPEVFHYPKEMYYRLLAFQILPPELDRILYLDPDILVLNPVRELYELSLDEYLYAAAYHEIISVPELNKIRLSSYDMDAYYNSGVLLMNLELQRSQVKAQEIFTFVEQHRKQLILPDQDILNALFAKRIKALDEKIYNYDARYYPFYRLGSNGLFDIGYILRHTVFLHFCGKKKPWKKDYNGKFESLYKHYEKLALG